MKTLDTKIFNGRKIKIRRLSKRDIRDVKKFQDFINSLVEENAQILINKKVSLKEEKEWLKRQIKGLEKNQQVVLVAETDNTIIGMVHISLGIGRQKHIGFLGISLRKEYRRIGLGTYLMKEIIKLTKKELKPKIIRLSLLPTNKPAIRLYSKFGFKKVAVVPKQMEFRGKLTDEIIILLYL